MHPLLVFLKQRPPRFGAAGVPRLALLYITPGVEWRHGWQGVSALGISMAQLLHSPPPRWPQAALVGQCAYRSSPHSLREVAG